MPDVLSVIQQIREKFPDLALIMDAEPEIAQLLFTHAQDSPAVFESALHATKWWKETPESARVWQIRSLKDPAWANQQRTNTATHAYELASSMGVPIHYTTMAGIVDKALAEGWSDDQLIDALTSEAKDGTLTAGTIQATATQLRSTAADYGVNLSDTTANDWAKKITRGQATSEGFAQYARNQSKLAYPTLAEEIDQGITVRQLADPYLQIASQLLGQDANRMNLWDPKWQRALQRRNKDGKLVGPMATLDWQRTIMEDPTYGYDKSEHARNAAFDLRDQLAHTFGVQA